LQLCRKNAKTQSRTRQLVQLISNYTAELAGAIDLFRALAHMRQEKLSSVAQAETARQSFEQGGAQRRLKLGDMQADRGRREIE